jgi:protein arginine kinase
VNDFFDRLARTPARWLSGHGPEARVVHSTRIRLARNIEKFPFPRKQDAGAQERLKREARRLCAEANHLKKMNILDVDTLGPLDREFLVERHLISREFAAGNGRLLLIDDSENVAIMVNEEDHFRFQVLRSGLDPAEAWRVIRTIERDVDNHVDFAFRPPWGYLTSCPTNLGTGMRVSALCHLPALVFGNELHEIVQAAGQVGINVRGFYGEGSEAVGNFVQFSNRVTMGHDEEEILGFMEGWIRQIIERELKAREAMLERERIELEDRVHRAFGVLTSARVMTSAEMMNLLSILRLGLDAGLIDHPDLATVNSIQIASQPAHLQRLEGKPLSPGERDQARARHIREKLARTG